MNVGTVYGQRIRSPYTVTRMLNRFGPVTFADGAIRRRDSRLNNTNAV